MGYLIGPESLRNFPHQVNQIAKLRGALEAASDLIVGSRDVGDDGVFGYTLTWAGIHTFRGLASSSHREVEQAILREQRKPTSSQGPRTFARDLRRTLALLGFLEHGVSGVWRITESGQRILELPNPPDPEATSIWVKSLMDLCLLGSAGEEGAIHPAHSMLRILRRAPGVEKRWLAFALSMADDSDAELNRVVALQRGTFESALRESGASEYMASNAVKIMPSLMEQLGLISIQAAVCTLAQTGLALANVSQEVASRLAASRRHVRRGYAVVDPQGVPEHVAVEGGIRTTEEQLHTSALLDERTTGHQHLVRRVVRLLRGSGQAAEIRVSDDAFDILASSRAGTELLLIEAKTMRDDALVQARVALGQLLFYEYFDVRHVAEGRPIRKVVAFDNDPGQEATDFLAAYDVACIVSGEGSPAVVPPELRAYFGNP